MKHRILFIAMSCLLAVRIGSAAPAAPEGAAKQPAAKKAKGAKAAKGPKRPQGPLAQPTAEEIAKIEAAMPAKARVQPQKPRKLLVFDRAAGARHKAIPYAAKTLEIMGRKTGAFEAVVTEDLALFEPDKLREFDGVCMNNTTREVFTAPDLDALPPEEKKAAQEREARLKASLLEFVRSGKGIVGIHAATDSLYQWPEYGEMMGGYFDGHPWHQEVTVKIDDPAHPLTAVFNGRSFRVKDEIYQFKAPYSREKLRVLLSIDTSQLPLEGNAKVHRTDGDFAVSWVRGYGKGRVFYCSLGHDSDIYWTPAILQYYLDGIQFALGDLPADVTPSAALKTAAGKPTENTSAAQPAQKAVKKAAAPAAETPLPSLEQALNEFPRYELGKGDANAAAIADAVVKSLAAKDERAAITKQMIALLDPNNTIDCKRFVCRQLCVLGTEEAVSPLAAMLADDSQSDIARYALERMPGEAAGGALRAALATTRGKTKIGVIDSIGQRRDRKAVAALAATLAESDAGLACASARALGVTGDAEAATALTAAREKASPAVRPAIDDGLLLAAETLAKEGDKARAASLYEGLCSGGAPEHVRFAALQGLVAVGSEKALPLVLESIASKDARVSAAGIALARRISGNTATQAFVAQLPSLSAPLQASLLNALADRGDRSALPAVVVASRGPDAGVRAAALAAVGRLGDASVVPMLTKSAAEAQAAEKEAARASLDGLRGPDIDPAMVKALAASGDAERAELLRALGARGAAGAAPDVLRCAREDKNDQVRIEAIRALGALSSADQMTGILDLLPAAKSDAERAEVEKAAASAARRIADQGRRNDAALAALAKAPDAATRCSLLRILGGTGAPSGLDPLVAALKDSDGAVQDAAIRSLKDWPTPAAIDPLAVIAKTSPNETHRVLALQGYARLLTVPSDRKTVETLRLYEQGFQIASRPEEKKTLLAGLASVRDQGALKLAEGFKDDPALGSEARQAVNRIQKQLGAEPKGKDAKAKKSGAEKEKGTKKPKAAQAEAPVSVALSPQRAGWKVSASVNGKEAANAIDGDKSTRWGTRGVQKPGQWFMVDLGAQKTIDRITLDAGKSKGDYPRGYEVSVSADGKTWGDPIAKGTEQKPLISIPLNGAKGRYIKIVQTGSTDKLWWSIYELDVQTN